jgi:transposase
MRQGRAVRREEGKEDDMDLSYVGIDIAKAKLDIAVRPSGQQWVCAHDEAGIADLSTRLQALQPQLIVVEATGGREIALVATLGAAGLPVVVINPRQVRDAGPRHRPAGQDRRARCGGPRALRRGRAPHAASPP